MEGWKIGWMEGWKIGYRSSTLSLDMNWFIGIMTTWKNEGYVFPSSTLPIFYPSNLPLDRKPEGKKVAEVSSTLPPFQSSNP